MINELREMLAGVMDGYKSALRAIINFSNDEGLETDAWDTFKEKVVDYHDAIVRGMIMVEDSLLADAAPAKAAISILEEYISEIETDIRIFDAKKRRLYSIENNTRNLFESASRLLVAVKYAIRDAGVEITGEGNLSNGKWRTTISDAYEKADSFRIDLRLQGFPEEYVECLMELHKKYPEWKFEAVVTGIDYQEFVDYQMNYKTKCVDINDEDIVEYSTGIDYEAEKATKYKEVSREGIIQFSNPCNIIRQAKDDYKCMIQFLEVDQEILQEYVDVAIPKIHK